MSSAGPQTSMERAYRARIGSTIDGKYQLLDLLGCGSMGAVYRAQNTWAGRECAVKVFHYEGEGKDAAQQRFVREARAANKVRKDGRPHPHVVDALDVGRDPVTERFFLVQELLRGETLGSYLRRQPDGRMDVAEAVALLAPVIDAIACAHEAGIVHRDLKPENVFLVDEGAGAMPFPKVLDFGVAQLADARMTNAQEMMGTPEYMSPESFFGARDVDARADVWALGVILYELVSGAPPFPAKGGNLMQIIYAIASGELPSLLEQKRMRPGPWGVVRRCLERDLAARYANARELLDALGEVVERVGF